MRLACALSGLILLFVAFGAMALEPVQFGSAPPGTKLVWKSRNTGETFANTVLEPVGNAVQFVNSRGASVRWIPFCMFCEGVDWYDEEAYSGIWPLDVGKAVKFRRKENSTGQTWENTIEVTGTETFQSPIGSYEVFVVECGSRLIGGRWAGEAKFLYSPDLRWHVSIYSSDNQGEHSSLELISYE